MRDVAEVEAVLELLEQEERTLSRRRALLHRRIDFVHSGGYAHVDTAPALDELRASERELSSRRRELHRHIEVARRERGRRRGTPATPGALR